MRRICVTIVFFLVSIVCNAQDRILIAAASDLKFALDSIVTKFNEVNKGKIDLTYGSSGKLSEQILNGAPFDIFFSADVSYPEILRQKGKVASEIYQYARGRIVLWSKRIDPAEKGIQSLLDPDIKKVAIASPQHAPYGKRAVESLRYYKMYESMKDKLVYGENISQTAQFISTGAADVGIIALSLALSPNMKGESVRYYSIPEESHQPLIQGVVITSQGKGNKLASAFFEYLKVDEAISVLKHFGFSKP
jgi:molybdate transport system substrate-binding protein